jgi:hypothetical protein
MEKFEISVSWNNKNNHFEVLDYMHHEGEQCKYEVFKEGEFIASFNPDGHKGLDICKNPGIVENGLLHQIAEDLEKYHI